MSLEAGIVTKLAADANVISVVGARIFRNFIPEDTSGSVIFIERQATDRVTSFDGDSGLVTATVEVTSFATSHAAVQMLAGYVRVALQCVVGAYGAVTVRASFMQNESDAFEVALGTDVNRVFGISQTFDITFED